MHKSRVVKVRHGFGSSHVYFWSVFYTAVLNILYILIIILYICVSILLAIDL